MKYSFHPEARDELNQAVDFYEGRNAELGVEFLEEVYSTIQRIVEFPKAFSRQSKNTRKCLVNRFPFAVIYQIKQTEIFIVAIAHLARKPGYWKDLTFPKIFASTCQQIVPLRLRCFLV